MERYGQVSPIVLWEQHECLVLIDGFKRLQAARTLQGLRTLAARRLELDESGAKAAVCTLNRHSRPPQELEEAWIVYALVREDGLSQVDAGHLLGRHKSWVNRRLAMWERLAETAQEELRLGLLSPSQARQLVRLPAGNQAEALVTAREASLTAVELGGVELTRHETQAQEILRRWRAGQSQRGIARDLGLSRKRLSLERFTLAEAEDQVTAPELSVPSLGWDKLRASLEASADLQPCARTMACRLGHRRRIRATAGRDSSRPASPASLSGTTPSVPGRNCLTLDRTPGTR